MFRFPLFVLAATVFFLSGCASTNYSKTATPVTITEQRIKLETGHVGVIRLVQVGDVKLGYYGPRKARMDGGQHGTTYTFDAGATTISAWYYDNQSGSHLVNQTPVAKMQVQLKPQGRYELRSTKKEGRLQFMVVDLETNASIAASEWVRLVQRPLPEPAGEPGTVAFPGMFRLIK